jgi:hypothetical protein
MRHQIFFRDAFNRDTSWITQEVIEEYAAATIKNEANGAVIVRKYAQGDAQRINLFMEFVAECSCDIDILREELKAEFGIQHFYGAPKTLEQHVLELEYAITCEPDGKKKSDLYGKLITLRGWDNKSANNAVNVNVNVAQSGQRIEVPRGDAREAERIVMSVFGSR